MVNTIASGHTKQAGFLTNPARFEFQIKSWFVQVPAVKSAFPPLMALQLTPPPPPPGLFRVRLRGAGGVEKGGLLHRRRRLLQDPPGTAPSSIH